METGWGSWKFGDENERLLARVLDKFATDLQCNDYSSSVDVPSKTVLSSLSRITSRKSSRFEVSSCSSSDDDDNIDGDFNAIEETRLSKSLVEVVVAVETDNARADIPSVVDEVPDALESSYFLQSQQPVLAEDHENAIKVIVELLNGGDYDLQELCVLLKTERENRRKNECDVSEIIRDLWPEMVTDGARHGLCEALVNIEVRPQVVCELIYLPWFKMCDTQLTGFIDSVSKLIVRFPEYACKSFLVDLLMDGDSILAKHLDWLGEIMKSLDRRHWCTLLSEYTAKHCNDVLDRRQIPILSYLVKNCSRKDLNDDQAGRLVALCKNAVHEHSANRDFAMFLVSVIGVVDMAKFRPEMTVTCGLLKGALKFHAAKALKDAK